MEMEFIFTGLIFKGKKNGNGTKRNLRTLVDITV